MIHLLKIQKNTGQTVLEIVIAISILIIILAILVPSLATFRNDQTIKNTTEDIISLLNEARTNTLSSENSTYYSVHFEANRAVYYTGGTFTDGVSSNKVITFDTLVSLPASGGISLNGSGSDVHFTRLSGDTNQNGTIIVRLVSDATKQKIITIAKTGIVSAN